MKKHYMIHSFSHKTQKRRKTSSPIWDLLLNLIYITTAMVYMHYKVLP